MRMRTENEAGEEEVEQTTSADEAGVDEGEVAEGTKTSMPQPNHAHRVTQISV
jgi:hypothetical protein